MKRSLRTPLVALVASLALAGTAHAAGCNYVLEGGSPQAQETVRAALNASSFDFGRVPAQITIRVSDCGCAGARPGLIVLDEAVLTDMSLGDRYSWALIQHEYAHQSTISSSTTLTGPPSARLSEEGTGATRSPVWRTTLMAASASPMSSRGFLAGEEEHPASGRQDIRARPDADGVARIREFGPRLLARRRG